MQLNIRFVQRKCLEFRKNIYTQRLSADTVIILLILNFQVFFKLQTHKTFACFTSLAIIYNYHISHNLFYGESDEHYAL